VGCPIHLMFDSMVEFSRSTDRTALLPVQLESKMAASGHFEKFKWAYLSDGWSDVLRVWFWGGVFGDGRSNGATSGQIKSKMAAGGHFENFKWPYFCNGLSDLPHVDGWVYEVDRSNGAIFGSAEIRRPSWKF